MEARQESLFNNTDSYWRVQSLADHKKTAQMSNITCGKRDCTPSSTPLRPDMTGLRTARHLEKTTVLFTKLQGSLLLKPGVLWQIGQHGGCYDPSMVKRRERYVQKTWCRSNEAKAASSGAIWQTQISWKSSIFPYCSSTQDPHLLQCSLGPQESSPRTWPLSIQPFLHSADAWQTDTPCYKSTSCNRLPPNNSSNISNKSTHARMHAD